MEGVLNTDWGIGEDEVAAVNNWLAGAAAYDPIKTAPTLTAYDIRCLLTYACHPYSVVANLKAAAYLDALRRALVVEVGEGRRNLVIEWGDAKPLTIPDLKPEIYVRVTRKGRTLLTDCCPKAWNQVLSRVM